MMLELKLSKDAWEKLSPALQELYKEEGGEYALQVKLDAREDVGPLKRALERVKADLDAERTARREAESKIEEIDHNDARKRGDIEKLTEQWDSKFKELAETAAAREEALKQRIAKSTVDSIVSGVTSRNTASKENAALLDPHVRSQLSVEFTDENEPQVLANGEPFDPDAFEKSVVDNPAYKAIIVSSRASGGGAADDSSDKGGGAFQTGGQGAGQADLTKVDPRQLASMLSKK
jgi:hypothetical protein